MHALLHNNFREGHICWDSHHPKLPDTACLPGADRHSAGRQPRAGPSSSYSASCIPGRAPQPQPGPEPHASSRCAVGSGAHHAGRQRHRLRHVRPGRPAERLRGRVDGTIGAGPLAAAPKAAAARGRSHPRPDWRTGLHPCRGFVVGAASHIVNVFSHAHVMLGRQLQLSDPMLICGSAGWDGFALSKSAC